MKNFVIVTLTLFSVNFINGQTIYSQFSDKEAAYLPDENKTYFMDRIEVRNGPDDLEEIYFSGTVAAVDGDLTAIMHDINPNLRPVAKRDKKRKTFDDGIGHGYVTCVVPGTLCVVLFPDKNHPIE